jgi:predicted extracellular nuclease
MIAALVPALASTEALAQVVPDVSISEVRIDQPSTDNDEYFELAGPAGTDLSGLTYLVIGDGAGGSGVIENVTDLSGQSIPASGFFVGAEGTFSLSVADLTTSLNFENDDNVTHLLVDGFTGSNGDDLDTNDDGTLDVMPWATLVDLVALVKEANPPTGTEFHYGPPSVGPDGSFVPGHAFLCPSDWQIGAFSLGTDDTPGTANTCPIEPVEALVINEIMPNPSAVSDDFGEWFEVFNPTGAPIDIDGWTIGDDDIDSHTINNGGPLVVPAGGYLVLGRDADSGINGGVTVDYEYSGFFLSNSGDEVVLLDDLANLIDRVTYSSGADVSGASNALIDPSLDNTSVSVNWCVASTPYGAGDLGTPGAANDCPLPVVVINEIIQNPSSVSDSAGEWFEVYNPGTAAVDIDGWVISDNGSDTHTITNGGPLDIPAGGYLVLGINDDSGTNGGVTVDYEYSSFTLANGDDEVVLTDQLGNEIDRVEYDGGPAFPDPTGASMALANPSLDNNVGANWCESETVFGAGDLGTPGAANDCVLFIHQVQGSGPSVAISGPVKVEGIVTSLFTRDDVLDGFFLQEENADADLDPATSEGIFVFCRGNCPAVPPAGTFAPGDLATVTGSAVDFFGMSQIDMTAGSVVVGTSGNPLPTAIPVDLPASASTLAEATFENLEGMLVSFPDTLVVSEYFQLARFGQIVLTESSRPFQFTHNEEPSVAGYTAFLDELATRRIILDDDNNDNNDAISDGPDEAYYYPEGGLSVGNLFRGGDTITDLTGVLHWSFAGSSGTDAWRVRPIPEVYDYTFEAVNARPVTPTDVGGTLKVASFNVLNYFTTIDVTPGDTGDCGPSGTLDCRGADSTVELERQRDKIVAALAAIDADVVGLVEIENNADASLIDLVGAMNAVVGAGTYEYIDTGFIGTDAIKVAFIYKPATVSAFGDFAILDSSTPIVPNTFVDTKNRPVLIQTFDEVATGARVTIAVNHLKSKGSDCDDLGDPDLDDGQANCNVTRTQAATTLVNYLATDPTGSNDPDFLIIGDLNAYAMEDPIDVIKDAGYTDLVNLFGGSDAYSYVFDGQLGYLDHALANGSLLSQVTGVTPWHINADEIPVFDYNDDIQDPGESSFERESGAEGFVIYAPDAYRSSDHDPVIVGLELDTAEVLKERALGTLEETLDALAPSDRATRRRINNAIARVDRSLTEAWWDGESMIKTHKVFDQERRAIVQLELVVASGVDEADTALWVIGVLLEADRRIAQTAIDAAIAGFGDPAYIAAAQDYMALAAADIAAGLYNEAVNNYKEAWFAAIAALM